MQHSPLVSVIMPVYNSEEYLEHAIHTVLDQSYDNFELLLVDDGSHDRSGSICDYWANHDSRVKAIHKENGGICSARNAGLEAAKGKYIAFCDNDDEYLPGLIAENVQLAEEHGKDVVRFLREHLIVIDGNVARREVLGEGFPALNITSNNITELYYKLLESGGGVWTGLYRKEILDQNDIRFPEEMKYGYEDLYFNLLVLSKTSNVILNPHIYYRWTERYDHSTSRRFSVNRLDSIRMYLDLEDEVNHTYSLASNNPKEWSAHLIDTHVIRMLQQLSLPMCDLKMGDKAAQLAKLVDMPALSQALRYVPVRDGSIFWKTRLIAFLLRHRLFRLLIAIYTINVRREERVY